MKIEVSKHIGKEALEMMDEEDCSLRARTIAVLKEYLHDQRGQIENQVSAKSALRNERMIAVTEIALETVTSICAQLK